MKPIHGKLLVATGVLHAGIVAPLIYWEKWSVFIGKMLFNVSPYMLVGGSEVVFEDVGSEAAVWFFIGGVLMVCMGQLMHLCELRHGRLPIWFAWEFLIVCLLFAWMLPFSGFTFALLPQAIFMLARSYKRAG